MMTTRTFKITSILTAWLVVLMNHGVAWAGITGDLVVPDVVFLIDSSGSMDWVNMDDNTDESMGPWQYSRQSCQNNDFNHKTSWEKMLGALNGKIDDTEYKCTVVPPFFRPGLQSLNRSANESYVPDNLSEFRTISQPHFRSVGCEDTLWWDNSAGFQQCIENSSGDNLQTTSQGTIRCWDTDPVDTDSYDWDAADEICWDLNPRRSDRRPGILDKWKDNVRFGGMTYDNVPSCLSTACTDHDKAWDYGDTRSWKCGEYELMYGGGCAGHTNPGDLCFDWNAGARGPVDEAVVGMVRVGDDSSRVALKTMLDTVEPLFCSPIGALLDDVGHYYGTASEVLPVAKGGSDLLYRCRNKLAILITDGRPTKCFEFAAGTCGGEDAWWEPGASPGDTDSDFAWDCPWKSSPEEARELFDRSMDILNSGGSLKPSDRPVYLVVVGFNVPTVDCSDPEQQSDCIEYSSAYTPCYVDPCGGGTTGDSGPGDGGPGSLDFCLMSPRQFLNEIACQGWPEYPSVARQSPPWLGECKDSNICDYENPDADAGVGNNTKNQGWALFADDEDELAAVLDLIISSSASTVSTGTEVTSWNLPIRGMGADSLQHSFYSGYISRPGAQWEGILYSKVKKCIAGGTDFYDIADQLSQQVGDRTIYSFNLSNGDTDSDGPPVLDTDDYATTGYSISGDHDSVRSWAIGKVGSVENKLALTEIETLGDGPGEYNDCDFGVPYTGCTQGDMPSDNVKGFVTQLIQDEAVLADIHKSTPSVLGPPVAGPDLPSFKLYQLAQMSREGHLFVASNDGVLHAFNIENLDDGLSSSNRYEEWGYIPGMILREVKDQYPIKIIPSGSNYTVEMDDEEYLNNHMFLLDGPTVAKDMLLVRRLYDVINPTEEKEYWRAVVVGGLGQERKGYYAIDVTNALGRVGGPPDEAPLLRWELSPTSGSWGNNPAGDSKIQKMGYSVAKPALTYVQYNTESGIDPRPSSSTGGVASVSVAAAIIPGGAQDDKSPAGNTGVYIVRLGDGRILRYLEPGYKDLDADGDMCPGSLLLKKDPDNEALVESAQLIGEPAVPWGTNTMKVASQAFLGDDRGRLWRIDMSDGNPENWCLDLFFDSLIAWQYPYENCMDPACTPDTDCLTEECCQNPTDFDTSLCAAWDPTNAPDNMKAPRVSINRAPTIAQDQDGHDVLVFGTGVLESPTERKRGRIFSVTDNVIWSGTIGGGRYLHKPQMNWWIGDEIKAIANPPTGSEWTDIVGQVTDAKRVNFPSQGGQPNPSGETAPVEFFNIGEKLIGSPVIFDKVAYFTTFLPLEDPAVSDACDAGTSRLWALIYNYQGENVAAFNNDDFGAWEPDSIGNRMFKNVSGRLLQGSRVTRAPRCDLAVPDLFWLTTQSAVPGETAAGSTENAIEPVSEPLPPKLSGTPAGQTKADYDSWTIVFI